MLLLIKITTLFHGALKYVFIDTTKQQTNRVQSARYLQTPTTEDAKLFDFIPSTQLTNYPDRQPSLFLVLVVATIVE